MTGRLIPNHTVTKTSIKLVVSKALPISSWRVNVGGLTYSLTSAGMPICARMTSYESTEME